MNKRKGFEHPGRGRRSEMYPDISLRRLGEKVGVSGSYVSRVLRGKRQGSVGVVRELAKELGIPVEELMR